MTPPLSPAIFITPSPLRVTTDQDHPMFSSQHPTGYTAKTNIRNPEILNTLNSSANHLPRGECNNMDFAGSELVYLQPGLVTATSAATTDFCLFPVDIRDHEIAEEECSLSPTLTTLKLVAGNLVSGWSSSVDL